MKTLFKEKVLILTNFDHNALYNIVYCEGNRVYKRSTRFEGEDKIEYGK